MIGNQAYGNLPKQDENGNAFRYLLEVYVDDFVSLVIPTSCKQLQHVSTGTMTGIHDVFPVDTNNSNDPISEKKLTQWDGEYSTTRTILDFNFDGINKTIWLEEAKLAHLLTVLHGCIHSSRLGTTGIPFNKVESVVAKICLASTAILAGQGILTPCNNILQKKLSLVYLQRNPMLYTAITGCQTLLRESSDSPTQCCKLVGGWPDYIGVCDALSHGVSGVIFGKNEACVPAVFCLEWSQDVKDLYQLKTITNSDLEMAGLLFLWLILETVCDNLREKGVALLSDNLPTVEWVRRLASRKFLVSAHLICALALQLKLKGTCPITPLHIAGKENLMIDTPLCSFGSKPKRHCKI